MPSIPLRIFVAMPGTDMGPNAFYKNTESIKKNLLEPVRKKLEERLSQSVGLIIEKDKKSISVIHDSMFSEARDADVYIADLTGANANVYLELGVRWALRDGVTVPIAQNIEKDVKFNVVSCRVIPYGPENIIQATDDIVEAIEIGLKNKRSDNPVRLNSELITIQKKELDNLKSEIKKLTEIRGDVLIKAAKTTESLSNKIELYKQALEANPALVEAMLELGKLYRSKSQYDESVNYLMNALRLEPLNATVHRELGVTYSKQKRVDLAVNSLREAVRLSPGDAEAWNNLGGALRRIGMAKAPDSYDRKALEESRNCYKEAHKINRYDLYSGLNIARLTLLLSKWDSGLLQEAKELFRKKISLCHNEVTEDPANYWRLFDLADAQLFSGDYDTARTTFSNAINLIPNDQQKDVLNTVLGPLRDYITASVLDSDIPLKNQVEELVKQYNNK